MDDDQGSEPHTGSSAAGDAAAAPGADRGSGAGVHASVVGLLRSTNRDLVAGLAAAQRAENLAMFEQLRVVAALWETFWPDDLRRRADARRRRRDISGESLREGLVVSETAACLGLTENVAGLKVTVAVALLVEQRLPAAADWAAQGRLDWIRLKMLVVKTSNLTVEQARAVEAKVLTPGKVGLTCGRFEQAIDRAVIAIDPTAAERRRKGVVEGRCVSFWKGRNGTDGLDTAATLIADGPADALVAAHAALDASALGPLGPHGPLSPLDPAASLIPHQSRCTPTTEPTPPPTPNPATAGGGAVVAMMAGRPQVPVQLNVTVTLQTLLGLNEHPGHLDGYGPIPAQFVRDLATHAIWRCTAVDDTHGTVLGVGTKTYTPGYVPGRRLREFLGTAAPTCEVPWCNAKAERCDLDHRIPHAHGGATCACNVGPLCSRHHRQKSAGELTSAPSTDPTHPPGTMIWITRTGQRIIAFPYAPLPPEAYVVNHPVRSLETAPPGEGHDQAADGERTGEVSPWERRASTTSATEPAEPRPPREGQDQTSAVESADDVPPWERPT